MRLLRFPLLFRIVTAAGIAAFAIAVGASEPLALRNLSPLYTNLGLPVMSGARLPDAGTLTTDAQLQLASHALLERAGRYRLDVDGETRRLDLRLGFSPSQHLRLWVNLPWVAHGGGRLDRVIDGWHDLWGLPDGPRRDQPEDRLLFAFDGADDSWALDRGGSGPGDIELGADATLHAGTRWALGGFASVKLPTGDRRDFRGSGETTWATGLRGERSDCLLARLRCHLQAGVAWLGDNRLDARASEWAAFYGLSLAWPVGERLSLHAQVEGHSVVYRSAPLDAAGTPLFGALGVRWRSDGGWLFEALFSEDLNVGGAPDITFQAGLRRRW